MSSVRAGDWVKVTETCGSESYGRVFVTGTSSDGHAIVGVQFACNIGEISDARSVQGFTKEHPWIKELSKNPRLRILTAWADIRYQSEITKLDSLLPFTLERHWLYDQTSDVLYLGDNSKENKSVAKRVQSLIAGPSVRYGGRCMFPACFLRNRHGRNWQLRDPAVIEEGDRNICLMPAVTGSTRKRRRCHRGAASMPRKRARRVPPRSAENWNCNRVGPSMSEVPIISTSGNSAISRKGL